METFVLRCVFLWALLQMSDMQISLPDTVSGCCEGDILLLLDSSGSLANYEFTRMLRFSANLLRPFTLGRGHVRVGLLQVGTEPHLEFDLDVHQDQHSLQAALQHIRQLKGDTNTVAALKVAKGLLLDRTDDRRPKVLLWLTDGVHPGHVDSLMSQLKARGVSVLAISTVHGNFEVLQRAVSPPLELHLYSVDIDSMEIITEDMREAIIKILHAQRLRVVHLTSHSAVLQWRPVLMGSSSSYELRYNSERKTDPETRIILPDDSSSIELTELHPDTTYTAFLSPESNDRLFNTLAVNFTTLSDVSSPATVSVSESGPHQIHVSWGPLQPDKIRRYMVEFGAFPSGDVSRVVLNSRRSSTVLRGLEPGTEYLVTVSALYMNGAERAMSVRACTKEAALPGLADLQLTPLQQQGVQVSWRGHRDGLRGYWLSWGRENSLSSSPSSPTSVYLPPTSHSTQIMHLTPRSRVCVSPIYRSGRGDGLCCTT